MSTRKQIKQTIEDISDGFAEGKMQNEDVDPHVRVVMEAAEAFLPFAPTQCDSCNGTGKHPLGADGVCESCDGLGILPWQPTNDMIERGAAALRSILDDRYSPEDAVRAVLVAAFREDGEVQP